MDKYMFDESNGLWYELQGDYYIPCLTLSEEDAKAMIVRGFAYPISKELPVEYAVEMNNLINLELEGAIG